jgi:eukaryotic-like serine/threonine-protein kinase
MFNQHLAFSKYRLLARLGSGGMADVFLAVSGHGAGGFNKLLVLKVLRPDLPATERADFFRMFQDEGRLAMRLSHPAIVQAYEVGSDDAVSFIAMEYLEGQPLSAIQERGWTAAAGISPELQIHVLCQVLDGLEYAHTLTDYSGRKLNIVHRDVSPQNVFVTYAGHTKLVDFGIAKTLESNSKTAAGVVKGKVPYMSPEQVRCGAVDHRADLFSVGVMLWEAVAQRSMHGNASLYEILQRLVAGDLPRLRDAVPDVDPELDRIAMRAMSRDPELRQPDAAALRDELLSFLERRGKVTSRELGERVAKLFEPERQAINEVIRKAMSDAADESFDTRPDHAVQLSRLSLVPQAPDTGRITQPTVPPSRELSPVPSGPPVVVPLAVAPSSAPRATGPVTDGAAALSPTAEVRAPKRRSRGAVLAAGGTAVLLVAIGLSSASRGLLTPGPTTPEAAAPAVVSQPLEARDKVRLSLQAHPSNAVFALDGQVLEGNPHRGERALDSSPHTLSVSAEGHEPRQIAIELTRDVDLEVRLAEAAPPPVAAAAQAPPSAAAPEPATASGRRRPRRAGPSAGGANDEDLYPDLPAPRASQNSARLAAPAAAASDDDLYPDLPAKKPRGAPKLDTSESPW